MLRGYLDNFEANPDTVVHARLSGINPDPAVYVLRISHADPHPLGPGFLAQEQSWPVTRLRPVTDQPTRTGSFGIVDARFTGQEDAATVVMWVLLTRLDDTSVIASWHTADGTLAVVADHGRFGLEVADDAGDAGRSVLASPHDLRERVWYFLAAGFSGDDGALLAWGQAGRTGGPYLLAGRVGRTTRPRAGSPLTFGGLMQPALAQPALDGKISAPCLVAGSPDPVALMDIMNWGPLAGAGADAVLAQWVFGPPGDLDQIADVSGHDRHGRLINAPALGVTGPPGVSMPAAVAGHDTVHFHRDDLDDCGWPPTHRIAVPADARSGIYVIRASDRDGRADLPFVVQPAANPPVLLLAPTFTWQAYGNLGRDPACYPGLSHYALHRDGSPVYVSTRLKPMPTLEPGARLEVDGLDSFAGADVVPQEAVVPEEGVTHLLMADLYVNWWLEQTGASYGVLTDATLHARGQAALTGCRTLVLSSHPEYWTRPMLDTLEAFIDGGGSVMYLGGNGLYWVTSVHPARPHLLEVRRTGGSQTWSAEPGESRHAFENQPGGIWRAQGRPPDALVGIGFADFGWDSGLPYRRTEASRKPEFAWVFDGTDADLIGTEGLNSGGAVAIEFDRYDQALAAPGCTVLASAYPERGQFFRSYEDGIGRAPDPLVRCDMTIRVTPAGGVVFSLGSIAAGGCLPVRDGRNDLARVCTNVLGRTLAAAP